MLQPAAYEHMFLAVRDWDVYECDGYPDIVGTGGWPDGIPFADRMELGVQGLQQREGQRGDRENSHVLVLVIAVQQNLLMEDVRSKIIRRNSGSSG